MVDVVSRKAVAAKLGVNVEVVRILVVVIVAIGRGGSKELNWGTLA